jgi:Na+/H+ antiporter NhaD/arsenite permease-like protein
LNSGAAIIFGAILIAVIARQLLLRGPPTWIIFLAGAFVMVASGVLPAAGASEALSTNLPTLLFLFSLFVLAAGLEQSGVLEHVARWVLGRARNPADLPFVLFVALGVVSAFIVNDALVLVGVPLLFAISRKMRIPAPPLLLTLAFSVSVGSVLTPFGNPQNLLVSLGAGLTAPISTFLRYLLIPTFVNLLLGGLYVRRVFGPAVAQRVGGAGPPTRVPFFPHGPWGDRLLRFPTVVVFPITLLVMITLDVTSSVSHGPVVPLYAVALGGAIVALALSPGRSELFARVDWTILVLFGSLFVVVAAVVNAGLLSALVSVLPFPGPGQPSALAAVIAASVGGSQLVSNVPWVALQIPIMHAVGYGAGTPWAWVALAAGSTLAGNVTLLGAASNLIIVGQAERAGVLISLRQFVKFGAPLAAMTILVMYGFLLLGL